MIRLSFRREMFALSLDVFEINFTLSLDIFFCALKPLQILVLGLAKIRS
jgi:hypothetical protein